MGYFAWSNTVGLSCHPTKSNSIEVVPSDDRTIHANLRFSEAAAIFLETRMPAASGLTHIAPRTLRDYGVHFGKLNTHFGHLLLRDITIEHFRVYQRARSTGEGFQRKVGRDIVISPAGADKINTELSMVKRILKYAGLWTREMNFLYLPFQERKPDISRALDPDEQALFLALSASEERFWLLHWYCATAVHLCWSSDEMRTIRQRDVNLRNETVAVNRNSGKNGYRRRECSVTNDACMIALEQLMKRSIEIGGRQPDNFLFPFRVKKNHYDATQHMGETGLQKQFKELRVRAGVPWFKWNGWRHTGATRMAEAGTAYPIMEDRMGHNGPEMMRHYVNISRKAERQAMEHVDRAQRKPPMRVHAPRLLAASN